MHNVIKKTLTSLAIITSLVFGMAGVTFALRLPVDTPSNTVEYLGPTGTVYENYKFAISSDTIVIAVNPDTNDTAEFKDGKDGQGFYSTSGPGSESVDKCDDALVLAEPPDRLNGASIRIIEIVPKLGRDSCGTVTTASLRTIDTKTGDEINSTTSSSGGEQTCDTALGSFSWLVCPIFREVAEWVDSIEETIGELLRMNEVNTSSGIYQSWAAIRTLANAILVLVALVAIASQIFNFEFVSAYTMKKMIPKIVIAAILLQLSFFLASAAIELFNAMGDGIESLILAPFGSGTEVLIGDVAYKSLAEANSAGQAFNYILGSFQGASTGNFVLATGAFFAIGATAFITGGGIFGLFMTAVIVGAAIAVAFITLVLRKVVILALIVALPLAIVAWILPNTSKWFDRWWGLFSKLLMMYPLVIGLLAAGKIAAYIMASSGTASVGGASIFMQYAAIEGGVLLFMVIIAYFGPFFFIPAMFKMAGGVFAKAVGSMEGFGSKYGRKAGESAKKSTGEYAASKYKPGARDFRGRVSNAMVRGGSGKFVPGRGPLASLGRKQMAEVASKGANFSKERTQQAEFLMSQAERNMSHSDYLKYLEQQGGTGDEYVAQAAHNKLVEQKGYAELDRLRHKRGEAEFVRRVAQGQTYGSIKQTNRTLLPSDFALAVEEGNGRVSDEMWGKIQSASNRTGVAVDRGMDKVTLLETVRMIDRKSNLSSMSADEIASSHDSIYESIEYDGDGNPTGNRFRNAQLFNADAVDKILTTPTIRGRLTDRAVRELTPPHAP